jgi:AraC-like DNA-binding protein
VLLLISSSGQPAAEIGMMSRKRGLEIKVLRPGDDVETALADIKPVAIAWDLTDAHPGDWGLVRRLRHSPVLSRSPFILYGQLPQEEDSEPTLAVGLTGFVVKSPDSQSLFDAINSVCPAQASGCVLIVDDDPEVRDAHQALVTSGFPTATVRSAADGESALAVMAEEAPALVLLDLVMPGLGGAEVLDQMRADPRLRHVPVVILSNKLLSLDDVKRLEHHARVTFQSKGVWSESETLAALNRALFGSDTLPAHTSALVKQVVAYLHHNFARPLSRWEVAAAIGTSEDYLTRIFNRELGLSPWDYLNRYRILQAKALLRNSSHSIGAIARQVGFKDQTYFSRVFHKQSGLSPQAYRDETARGEQA